MAKVDGVTRVHPNGMNGKVLVHVSKKGALTKDKVKALISEHAKFRLRKFKRA